MIIVLMAAYNEAATLSDILARMPARIDSHHVRTIVVSDGSTDGTADVARNHGAEVMEFPRNRGKGATLKSGLASIANDRYAALVFMDADGQHDPDQLASVVTPVLSDTADLVIGSRYLHGSGRANAPWNRYLVRSGAAALLRLVLSDPITDPFSGFRAMNRRAVGCIDLRGDRYESELEMLFCAERNGQRITEVEVPKIYGPQTSKMGARYGSLLGRIDVVMRYGATIVRGAYSLRRGTRETKRRSVSA